MAARWLKVLATAPLMLASLTGTPAKALVPYVVWSVIYTLMRVLKYRLGGETLPINVVGIIFFGGAAVQLYFLPLLLLFQAQALSVILLFRANYWRLIGSSVALGAVLFGYS